MRPPRPSTSGLPRPLRARRRSKRATPCRPPRCARCSLRLPRRSCRRTTFTVDRPWCIFPGTSSSAALAADEHSLIPVICGPTSAGKSAIALWLALRQPTTIIVADSRQIYRRFDVGTAKPSSAEIASVPHRGIDIIEPTERYSAAAWAASAEDWIEEAQSAGRTPLVVGGTGFYLRALFEPLFEEPALDAVGRRRLEQLLAPYSLAELKR